MSNWYSILPAGLQPMVQNGLLDKVFMEALAPMTVFDQIADVRPWGGEQGAVSIMTRAGLMPLLPTPITGSDAGQANYGLEQFTLQMNQYGQSIDTNMAVSAMALASRFLEDNQKIGENAALSLNLLAQQTMYNAYNGVSYITGGATSASQHVADAGGFDQVAVLTSATTGNTEGLNSAASMSLVPVSASNPLTVTVNGVANTVTGVAFDSGNSGPGTLTLGSSVTSSAGWVVVSNQTSQFYRPNARTSQYTLASGDIATLALFQQAVAYLRSQNVPTIGGAYTAQIPAQTVQELFQDPNFLSAYRGRGDSPVYRDMALGRFAGIDWVPNEVIPSGTTPGSVQYWRPFVCGQGALIKGPFAEMGSLVSQMNAGATVHVEMINGVARITRAPLDRLGQVLTTTWSFIGGYAVGSDFLTNLGQPITSAASAVYKRAVIIEHA